MGRSFNDIMSMSIDEHSMYSKYRIHFETIEAMQAQISLVSAAHPSEESIAQLEKNRKQTNMYMYSRAVAKVD